MMDDGESPTSDLLNPQLLTPNQLDDIILGKYLSLINARDEKIQLQATQDLAKIRGHFARAEAQKGPSTAQQINNFTLSPDAMTAMASGMKALTAKKEE